MKNRLYRWLYFCLALLLGGGNGGRAAAGPPTRRPVQAFLQGAREQRLPARRSTAASAAAAPPADIATAGVRETDLPNGLKVLTKEVHAAPVVSFQVFYHVGSRNEHTGITGISHLLEHMMFKGTKRYQVGEIARTLAINGASFNATTTYDYTSYFETLASDRLELAMQIESDRMVNSLIDAAQMKSEMTVVRSELEGLENNTQTLLDRDVWAAAYKVHPYHWPTIGSRVEVENIPRSAVYSYYKRYYGPNNATVVIVGDFNTDRALAMVRHYFGSIKPIPPPPPVYSQEPPQHGERRVVVDRPGNLPLLEIAYHIPEAKHPDFYALDVLDQILTSGSASRLALALPGLAVSADSDDVVLRDPSLFQVNVTPAPGVALADLEKATLAQLERLKSEDVSEEELRRAKNVIGAFFVYSRDSVTEQATWLGQYHDRVGWRYLQTYLDRMRAVTAADVRRVAQKYLVETNRTVGWFAPTGEPASPGAGPVGETAARAEPAPPNARPIPLPKPSPVLTRSAPVSRTVLPNGIVVIVAENHSNSTVWIRGSMASAGSDHDPRDRPGLAGMTAGMLSLGTQRRSSVEVARDLETVGASSSFGANEDDLGFGGRALSKDLDRLLDVMADELRHPTFPAAVLDLLRQRDLAVLQQGLQDPAARAYRAFLRAIYPAGHPYRPPAPEEEEASLKAMTRDDLQEFYRSHYGPDTTILVIVGDVTPEQAVAAVRRHFGDWARDPEAKRLTPPNPPLQSQPVREVISTPGKAEVIIDYGFAGQLTRNDPDFYAASVMSTVLGGGGFGGGSELVSRLARRIRDQEGLVYGVYSYFVPGDGAVPFVITLGTNPINTQRALSSLERQVAEIHEHGVTDRERDEAVAFITGSFPVRLDTNDGIAQNLLTAEHFHLGMDYIQKYASYYEAVTTSQVNEAAREHLRPDRATVVIAGSVPPSG